MTRGEYCLFCLLLLSCSLNKAVAQTLTPNPLLPETLTREAYSSQGRGVDFLLKSQSPEGGWNDKTETTALSVIALYGIQINEQKELEKVNASIEKAKEYLRKCFRNKKGKKNDNFRSMALALFALSYHSDPKDENMVKQLRESLLPLYSRMSADDAKNTLLKKNVVTFFWLCCALDISSATDKNSTKCMNAVQNILSHEQKRGVSYIQTSFSYQDLFLYAVAMSEKGKYGSRYESWRVKLIKQLLNLQTGSGAWGSSRSDFSIESSPVSTAYALLTMEFALGGKITGLK